MTADPVELLAIHGPRSEAHDYHAGTPGAFAAVMRAAEDLRERRVPFAVRTLLTRSSFRVLSDLPPLLRARGAAAWCVELPLAEASSEPRRFVPRLALALPFALHALSRAHRLGLPAFIRGAPLCLLGPYAAHALRGPERAFGAPCDGCAARPRCPGLDPWYLARFAGDEIRPREATPHGAAATDLARAFE